MLTSLSGARAGLLLFFTTMLASWPASNNAAIFAEVKSPSWVWFPGPGTWYLGHQGMLGMPDTGGARGDPHLGVRV